MNKRLGILLNITMAAGLILIVIACIPEATPDQSVTEIGCDSYEQVDYEPGTGTPLEYTVFHKQAR
jgi:hypothetical protein